jgi:hypothetical protein
LSTWMSVSDASSSIGEEDRGGERRRYATGGADCLAPRYRHLDAKAP